MPLTPPLQVALRLLQQAHTYKTELDRDDWDFAVELATLRAVGLTSNDIRWLLYQDYVTQAAEFTSPLDDRRRFRPLGKLALTEESCFILTPQGLLFAESAAGPPGPDPCGQQPPGGAAPVLPGDTVPVWDKDRRALLLGPLVVKQFKVPAPNQEVILASFEEERWPLRVDDPLPPHAAIDPKRRLHDTINSLNRNQRNSLLHFSGDGSGEGVRWEPANGAGWPAAAAPPAGAAAACRSG